MEASTILASRSAAAPVQQQYPVQPVKSSRFHRFYDPTSLLYTLVVFRIGAELSVHVPHFKIHVNVDFDFHIIGPLVSLFQVPSCAANQALQHTSPQAIVNPFISCDKPTGIQSLTLGLTSFPPAPGGQYLRSIQHHSINPSSALYSSMPTGHTPILSSPWNRFPDLQIIMVLPCQFHLLHYPGPSEIQMSLPANQKTAQEIRTSFLK